MINFKKLLLLSLIASSTLFAGVSYKCVFTKKVSYSGFYDKTPNQIRHVHMGVIYRVDGKDLLTKPDKVNRTYTARLKGKVLDRFGNLYYVFRSDTGYSYGLSEDKREAIEITPSGKTVLYGKCHPLY